MTSWPQVALGEILTQSAEWVRIDPDESYRLVTVRLRGQGLVERARASSLDLSGQRRHVIRTNQLVVARIDARNGALGIVPPDLDGSIVSNDFPAFVIDQTRVVPEYLAWLTRSGRFVEACGQASEGTTNRVRLSIARFLAIRVPLPSLDLQACVARRLARLYELDTVATSLMNDSVATLERLTAQLELSIWPTESLIGAPSLEDVTIHLARGRQSRQGSSDHFLIKTQHVQMGQYITTSITLGPDAAASVSPSAVARPGDVLIACSAAGCLGRVAFYQSTGVTASTDTHVAIARADTDRVLPEYLYRYVVGAQGQRQLRSRERGDWKREKVGFRLTELNLRDLQQVPVPLPSIAEQRVMLARLRHWDETAVRLADARKKQRQLALRVLPTVLNMLYTSRHEAAPRIAAG